MNPATPTSAPANATAIRTEVELASLRRRLASMLYEGLPAFGVMVVGGLLPMTIVGMTFHVTPPGWFLWLYVFVLMGCYFVTVWRKAGQTLAMQTWSLQLVDAATGKAPSLRQLIVRYTLAWPSLVLILAGVGILWAAFVDRDRQFAHDRLAGTCLVFNPRRKTR
ncbi:RDD family protein [Uliginosibacterium sp. sgz301328]|uniref:RDD family protein n=1 Tax=Uliginosibacterium sp. sgz301328 TaxID=3243764 RepID=UPI00359CC706